MAQTDKTSMENLIQQVKHDIFDAAFYRVMHLNVEQATDISLKSLVIIAAGVAKTAGVSLQEFQSLAAQAYNLTPSTREGDFETH